MGSNPTGGLVKYMYVFPITEQSTIPRTACEAWVVVLEALDQFEVSLKILLATYASYGQSVNAMEELVSLSRAVVDISKQLEEMSARVGVPNQDKLSTRLKRKLDSGGPQ